MTEIAIPCGYEKVHLTLSTEVNVLEPRPIPALDDPTGAVAAALKAPIGCPPLHQLARDRRSACVVISDLTRPVPNRVILPPLLATLESAGIERSRITILVATGTHRPNLGEELVALVGDQIAATYKIVNHDCHDRDCLRHIGDVEGAPVEINTAYLNADLKILTGLIEPHPYAGYSGGAKSILPGLSGFETMKFMHSFEMISRPGLASAVLEGNPFYQATREVAGLAGGDFVLNVIINKERKTAGVFAGELHEAHLAGCRKASEFSVIRMERPADLVITSGGGAPMDATFYQCGKGIVGANAICRQGGTVLMICGCAQGIGSETYAQLVETCGDLEGFTLRYGDPENFVMDQWAAQCYFQVLRRIGRVLVYSPGLSAEQLRPFGVRKVDDLQKEVERLLPEHPRVAVVPQGPYVVGLVGADKKMYRRKLQ